MSADEGGRAPALTRLDLGQIALLRAVVSVCLLVAGFRAVSDDDFARVVIAQEWAHAPKLDPSGTSWLPFPFWLTGAVMLLLGRSLFVAQIVAFALGVASSLLVAISAHRITASRRAAVIAGLACSLVGWSAWLGVATVPELFTAALTLFAAASLTTSSPRDRFFGALALLAATLSRYEPWPVAITFALWTIARPPVLRAPAPAPTSRLAGALFRLAPAAIALAGPVLWIAWNRVAHGDPLHFVARVAAYHRAVGQASSDGVAARLLAYPSAFARELPEVLIALLIASVAALSPRWRPEIARSARRSAAPLVLAAAQVAALSISLVKDGAPTHHPERALLFPALALVVLAADVAGGALSRSSRAAATTRIGASRATPATTVARAAAVAAVLLLARAILLPVALREEAAVRSVRGGWLLLGAGPRETFADRRAETDAGALAASELSPGARAYLEDVRDYAYFAVQAGSGRPESLLPSREIDPRHPGKERTFESERHLHAWLVENGFRLVIARRATGDQAPARFGKAPLHRTDRYVFWAVPDVASP